MRCIDIFWWAVFLVRRGNSWITSFLFFLPFPIPALSQKGEATEKKKKKKDKPSRMKTFSSSGLSEKECKVSRSQLLHKVKYFYHLFLQDKTYQRYHRPYTDREKRQTGIKLLPLSECRLGTELIIECKTPQTYFSTYRIILSLLVIFIVITFHWSQLLLISPTKKASNTRTYTPLKYLLPEKSLQ